MALAAMTLTASAAVNYETDPAEGTVQSLKEVSLALTDYGRNAAVVLVNGENQVSIPVTCDGESIASATAEPSQMFAGLNISLAQEATTAGEYKITIPANTIKVDDLRGSENITEDIVLTYNVAASSGDEYFTDYTANPAEGVVDQLESVWVTINGAADVASTFETSKITIKKDGQPIDVDFSDGLDYDKIGTTYCTITFDKPITEPGTYEVIFGAGYITTSTNFKDYTPLNQPVKLTYTIEGSSSDENYFTDYTANPAEGVVDKLESVWVTINDVKDVANNPDVSPSKIVIRKDGQPIDVDFSDGLDYDKAWTTYCVVTFDEPITAPGTYDIIFPAGYIMTSKNLADYTPLDQPVKLTYTIEGSSSDENYFTDYTAIPAEGVVDKLESVWVTINGVADVASTLETSKITIKKDGEPIDVDFSDGLDFDEDWTTYCVVSFDEPITEPGTYEVIFGAGYITTSTNLKDYTPLNQPIKLTYTIGGNTGFDFTKYTATPSNETTLEEISTVTMTYSNVDSAECSVVVACLNDKNVAEDNIKITNEGNTVKFEFTPAIAEEGNLKITIPNGGMRLNKGGETEVNSTPIELTYAIKPQTLVAYVYEFEFSNPKPNENGEISTEKDLQGMQFYVDKAKGLNVPEDLSEETVATMKQTDGEWETTGTISKSYGLNSERSYFLVAWKAQPQSEGEYTITIPEGVVGDEAWLANHKTGNTNKETVLTFKLVSPSTAVENITVETVANGVYNLTGVRVADKLENLPAGIYIYGGKKVVVK